MPTLLTEAEIKAELERLILGRRKRGVRIQWTEVVKIGKRPKKDAEIPTCKVTRTFNPRDPVVKAQINYWSHELAGIGVTQIKEVK